MHLKICNNHFKNHLPIVSYKMSAFFKPPPVNKQITLFRTSSSTANYLNQSD